MPDSKLSLLPAGAAIADADLFYSDKSGVSVKQPASAFKTYFIAGGIGAPGGAASDVQFNNSGVFGGDGGFTYAGAGGPVTLSPAANVNPFNITGGSTTGSGTDVLGLNVTGTLNTTGVVDGAALFANITNTASGVGSSLLDLQVNSASKFLIDLLGDIFMSGDREISSSTSLTITQTGDTFGPTGFEILNRFGANGARFTQSGTVSVVDFIFNINGTGGANGQNNIRYERRGSFWMGIGQADHEFQIGIDGSPTPDATFFTGNWTSGLILQPSAGLLPFNFTFVLDTTAQTAGAVSVADHAFRVNGSGPNTGLIFGRTLRFSAWTPTLVTTADSKFEWRFSDEGQYSGGSNVTYFSVGDTVVWFGEKPQFSVNTTGAGSALLGGNCPAVTLAAPYTWIEALSSDGSLVYIPAWK